MSNLAKAVFYRFLRGGIAGALSMATTITVFSGVTTWSQLQMALSALGICLIVGFITGSLMGADKYLRALPEEQ